MRQWSCCCLLALLCPLTVALADDWPQWRGPHRDGISQETGLLKEWPEGGPKLLWNSKQVNSGKGIGHGLASVVVADHKIFTMGDRNKDDMVFCLDEATGKELWATRIAPASGGGPPGPRSTPTVAGDRVYALNQQGILTCLNTSDGAVVWTVDYQKQLGGRMMSGWNYSESPLVDGDKLICTPGGPKAALAALNKETGSVIWKTAAPDAGGAGYASIVTADVGGIRQYITWMGHYLIGVEAKTGKLLWRYSKAANGTANIPTPIVKGDLVFCSTAYEAGSALLKLVPNGEGGIDVKEQYFLRPNKLQNHHGGLILVGDYVYGGHGHNNGLPFCLNLKTGEFAWGPERGPGRESAAVVYADGNLYFRYQDGTMALIEATPEGMHVKGVFHLPSYTGTPSWPHPVVANGRLYIRGQDVVLCYDVKQK